MVSGDWAKIVVHFLGVGFRVRSPGDDNPTVTEVIIYLQPYY